MSDWQGAKTDWTPEDDVTDEDFDRIETNTKANREDIDDLSFDVNNIDRRYSAGNFRVYIDQSEDSGHSDNYKKTKEVTVGFGSECRVKFKFCAPTGGAATVYAKIYKNSQPVGIERSTKSADYNTYTEDININPGDKIQIYTKSDFYLNNHPVVKDLEILVDKGLVAG
ncbi:hypothetical protein [Sporohalobacter salinus]|uniref:hypothetical protein n=1 Tax=Sporohalobacter salinus TaxID=1494606 RepID=UPI00195FFDA8|nr:hypothetical protein [Sporohalobacter salinus]MBM7624790.1 hypothetical protein [Sporohalobacter salinus]